MPEPYIPQSGKPVEARWARDLIFWIKNEIKPRGDGKTTIVKDNTVTALVPEAAAGGEMGQLTAGPSGGYGQATWNKATIAANGTWSATGPDVAVIVALLR